MDAGKPAIKSDKRTEEDLISLGVSGAVYCERERRELGRATLPKNSLYKENRNQRAATRKSEMSIVVKMLRDNKTLTERRGITLTAPPKEGRTGRLSAKSGLATPLEKVREFQRGLYLKAKQKKEERFYSLYDKVYRWDILLTAWRAVRKNKGSAGADGKTIKEIEIKGLTQFLMEIQRELKNGEYKPQEIKRVYIPKSNGGKRGLGIPTVKDRVVQMAMKIVIEPVFEADFQDCSYGFRPKRRAHQAIKKIKQLLNKGYTQVVDVDLKAYFDTIPHDRLLKLVAKRIADKNILKIIKLWLKAGVASERAVIRNEEGTPQGGVISPLLANIYLNELDKVWKEKHERYYKAQLIRYADDFVVLTPKQTQGIQKTIYNIINWLGLKINDGKTRILNMEEEKLTFLGFSFKKIYDARKGVKYIISFPSSNAMKTIRHRIRTRTDYRIPERAETIVSGLNSVIRGWVNYFAVGNSSKWFGKLRYYLESKIRRFIRKRSLKKGHGYKSLPNEYLYKKLGVYYITTNRLHLSCESH